MRHPAPIAWFDQIARGWRGYILVALIALASGLIGAGRMPVLDRDEARFAQATRQMLETGDFIRIRIQNEDRNKKPIGIHWLQAAAVEAASPLTQRLNEIWPYRLPSALGAMLAAISALWAGHALLSRRAATMGAVLFAAGMLIGAEGMIAKTDAVLCGFTTLAMAALAQLYSARTQRPRMIALLFWAAVGCGVLIKGPVTPLVAGLALLTLGLWEKRRAWMKPLLWWPGPLLAALIVAPWLIAIQQATHGAFVREAVGVDLSSKVAGGSEGHGAAPGYHLLLLPFLIFPATFALPAAFRLGWNSIRAPRRDEECAGSRFLVAWALPAFLIFELLPTKLPHYPLPTYPAIALLCGAAILAAARERWRGTTMTGIVLFAVAGAALVGALAWGSMFMPGDFDAGLRRAITAALMGAIGLAATVSALISLRPTLRVASAVAFAFILSYALRDRVLPEARELHVSSETVAALARARLLPRDNEPFWVVGYGETSLVFNTRTSIRISSGIDAGENAGLGETLLVEQRQLAMVDAELARRALLFTHAAGPVRGLDYGNGKRVALYFGIVEEAPAWRSRRR